MFSSTHIRFIRNPSAADQATDDLATIRRTDVDQYELTYITTNTESGAANVHTINTDDKGVFRWFRSIIGLLEADMEPFHRIQIDFPAAPSVMLDARHIGDHYRTILDALELWLDDGELSSSAPPEEEQKTPPRPTRPVSPSAPSRQNRHHMFFDLGDNDE